MAVDVFQFLDIAKTLRTNLDTSISRLGEGGIEILNLVVPKPEIPNDIAFNYKQVVKYFEAVNFI